MGGDHLITDEETRRFAEDFLNASPWLGDIAWERIVIGPDAGYLADFDGVFPEDAELREGQQWSWKVSFSDPAGTKVSLTHQTVLKGLGSIVYGSHEGSEGFRYLSIQQWFTEPSNKRRELQLPAGSASLICQWALYGKIVFPTGEDSPFGKLDMFSEQRTKSVSPQETPEA